MEKEFLEPKTLTKSLSESLSEAHWDGSGEHF